jgi:hypothetical protein
MNTVKVPIVGSIEGEDGQDPMIKFSLPKRKSRKDLQIEKLTKDLEEAKRGLRNICEAVRADDKDYSYRVGMCHSIASWTLKVLGDSSEDDRFMAEINQVLERYKQNGATE